jgi:tetratricopeptide (TPR) repeat protein
LTEAGKKETATLRVNDKMSATLIGGGAFDVSPSGPQMQLIDMKDITTWTWEVTPKLSGAHYLILSFDAILTVDGKEGTRNVTTLKRKIDVEVTWPETASEWVEFLRKWFENIGWFWTAVLVPFGLYFVARWRKWVSGTGPVNAKHDLSVSDGKKGGDTNGTVTAGQIASGRDPTAFSKLTPLQKAVAIAVIVGAIVVIPLGLYQLFRPSLPTLQQSGVGNVQVQGEGNTPVPTNNIGPKKEQIEQIQKPSTEQLTTKDFPIADLIKLIKSPLEKNLGAAPSAQQAVGGAVQSIAQGAAEGDPRLQQALSLLKENKTAEASQLLKAVAEEKAAHAEQAGTQAEKDRKEAAIAFRNLGAIAGLAEPKRALEAYEKAAALDPDDIESLFWAGYIQLGYGDLAKAQTRLEHVLKLAEIDERSFYKFWPLIGLGDIKQQRGELTWALKFYNDGVAIVERLATSDPGNAGCQRDLSVSYEKVGGVQVAQGNLAGALNSYSDGLAIRDRLAKSDPGNAGWQRDLSVSYAKLANAHRQSRDRAKALAALRQGHEIILRMTKLSPDNATWKKDLAWFEGQIKELALQRRSPSGH